jgi:hypothetical protein
MNLIIKGLIMQEGQQVCEDIYYSAAFCKKNYTQGFKGTVLRDRFRKC